MLERAMWNDNDKVCGSAVCRACPPVGGGDVVDGEFQDKQRKSSVSELERMASSLRETGEHHVIERIDHEILTLLERKIFRKVVAKGRRERWAALASYGR